MTQRIKNEIKRIEEESAPMTQKLNDISKSLRGFASMSKARLKQISSKGGSKSGSSPKGFASLSPQQLKAISKRGGQTSGKPKGLAAISPERRLEIVRMGGLASKGRKK